MSDSEDASSRRPQRPSTPPFRGPTSPSGKPPLTPPAGGSRAVPSRTPGIPGSRAVPAQPFMPPPASPGGRPTTPAQGGRRPAATPARPAPTPSSAPAYGTAPPASVAATLQSIAEFTIVDGPDQGAATDAAAAAEPQRERLAYDAPSVVERSGEDTGGGSELTVEDPPVEGIGTLSHSAEPGITVAGGRETWPEADAGMDETMQDEATSGDPFEAVAVAYAELEAGDEEEVDTTSLWALDEGSEAGTPFDAEAFAESPGGRIDDESLAAATAGREMDTSADLAAASLEEIARQLRSGEVRVGSIDSRAEPPAILAAVLAAMLSHRR